MTGDEMRIGDQERDAAIEMLQEHMSAGRLTAEEFNDRMSRALEAKYRSDITPLFTDLPSPRPPQADPRSAPASPPSPDWSQTNPAYDLPAPTYGAPTYGPPATYGHHGPHHRRRGMSMHGRPWYAQWYLLIIAIVLTSATGGRLGFIVPLVAIWIFVIAPSIARGRQSAVEEPHGPPRPLTFYEREELISEIRADRPMTAIRRYRELTGADLITARIEVEKLRREIGG